MHTMFRKGILLKWLFLPVILCVHLIVVQVERLVLSAPICNVFHFPENHQKSDKKRNTIVDDKIRMDN